MLARHELTDSQWNKIEPLITGKKTDRGCSGKDNRLFVNAVFFVGKTGIPWRDLPERFGNWNSVWRRFDRWCKAGIWQRLAQTLGDVDLEELQLDSTSIKAQHSAAGSRRKPSEKKKMPTPDAVSVARGAAGARSSTQR